MINPYILLGLATAWFASCAGAYLWGYEFRDGRVAQEVSEAQAAAIAQQREQAASDLAAAIVRARAEATASERARNAKTKGIDDANRKARPDCGRDAESLGLLHSAIDAANGTPAAAGSLPGPVPATTPAR